MDVRSRGRRQQERQLPGKEDASSRCKRQGWCAKDKPAGKAINVGRPL